MGKSTVSVNLAVALARLGKKVGIIDADIYGFSVPDMMGIEKRPIVRGDKIIPVERLGVKVISMGFFVEDNAPVIWRYYAWENVKPLLHRSRMGRFRLFSTRFATRHR